MVYYYWKYKNLWSFTFEKIAFKEKRNRKINFIGPKEIDEDSIKLYIISDSYFGLELYNLNLKQNNNKGIMDKYGIIEIKNKKEEKENIIEKMMKRLRKKT